MNRQRNPSPQPANHATIYDAEALTAARRELGQRTHRQATELSHAWAVAERGWAAVGMGSLMALAFGTNHHDVVMQASGVALGVFSAVQVWACQRRLLRARR